MDLPFASQKALDSSEPGTALASAFAQ